MLQADAEVVADVGRGNPLSVEGLRDETRVLAPVVPHHDTKEWSETLSLSSLGLKGPTLGEILLALAFVEVVGRPAQDQEPSQDDLPADGELIRELLTAPVAVSSACCLLTVLKNAEVSRTVRREKAAASRDMILLPPRTRICSGLSRVAASRTRGLAAVFSA
jgi:hypothetical protein